MYIYVNKLFFYYNFVIQTQNAIVIYYLVKYFKLKYNLSNTQKQFAVLHKYIYYKITKLRVK